MYIIYKLDAVEPFGFCWVVALNNILKKAYKPASPFTASYTTLYTPTPALLQECEEVLRQGQEGYGYD